MSRYLHLQDQTAQLLDCEGAERANHHKPPLARIPDELCRYTLACQVDWAEMDELRRQRAVAELLHYSVGGGGLNVPHHLS